MKKIIIFLLAGLIIGFFVGGYLGSKTIYIYNETLTETTAYTSNNVFFGDALTASIKIPAIDARGRGVATDLLVQVKPGTGRVLVNINNLLFWVDTQYSIRTAIHVAENITGMNASKYDFIYNIDANASIIGGGSAGASLTIATIAALEGKKPNPDVMITGTINSDGSIGPIGGVLEKAKAAESEGAKIFLVPLGQAYEVAYRSVRHCERFGRTQICTIETIPQKKLIGEKLDIEIKEVGDINETLQYFFK